MQISALKQVYGDKNVTVHFTRDFASDGSLFKDGKHLTSPLYYILNEDSIQRLNEYLQGKYPSQLLQTETVLKIIHGKMGSTSGHQVVENVVTNLVTEKIPEVKAVVKDDLNSEEYLLRAIKSVIDRNSGNQSSTSEEEKIRQKRLKKYDPKKTFEQEYSWVPALFNALYFTSSPIIAGAGVLFFFGQLNSIFLFVMVALAFIFLEVVFRRTIVRKCVSAFMRGKYMFGTICLFMSMGISAWSIVALWNGTEQIDDYKGRFLKQSDETAEGIALADSLTSWRAQHKDLEGKWGVALHRSKDLLNRINEGEKRIQELKVKTEAQTGEKIALWRYLFLLTEAIVLLSLVLPVWYDVRCVLLLVEQ